MTLSSEFPPTWLQRLAQRVPPETRAALNSRLEGQVNGASHPLESPTAQLLAFYIAQAQANNASPDTRAQTAGAEALTQIRSGLNAQVEALAATPAAAPVAAAAPAAPPAPIAVNDPTVSDAIRTAYQLAVQRNAVDEEVEIWQRNLANGLPFHEFLLLMSRGEEADRQRAAKSLMPDMSDGDFVILLFRLVKGRSCNGYELDAVRRRLARGGVTRQGLLGSFFAEAFEEDAAGADQVVHDGLSCSIMGTPDFLTLAEWQEKAKDKKALADARAALKPATPYTIGSDAGLRVSAITSLFRGGDFIEQFMDNITGQTCFDSHCELIIIDADSPENEAATIERYLRDHPSIRYQRMNSCIGIYEAWNIGVDMARGRYLTNANLDDLRREDSFEIQAGALDALPFVDVVYQDFYYSFDPMLSWDEVAAFGYKSQLPVITPHNMLRYNSPHNAPMWRRSLHKDVGKFDGSMKSAGDYEFWLRCLAAGKSFFKINEPHVVYYQNPKGLSTRADTRGVVEAKATGRKYVQDLMPEALTCNFDDFLGALGDKTLTSAAHTDEDRHVAAQAALRNLTRRFKMGAS